MHKQHSDSKDATAFSRTHKKSISASLVNCPRENWKTVETAHCVEMRAVIGGVGFVWVLTGRG
jgi:hypothetical protein